MLEGCTNEKYRSSKDILIQQGLKHIVHAVCLPLHTFKRYSNTTRIETHSVDVWQDLYESSKDILIQQGLKPQQS